MGLIGQRFEDSLAFTDNRNEEIRDIWEMQSRGPWPLLWGVAITAKELNTGHIAGLKWGLVELDGVVLSREGSKSGNGEGR